MSIVSGNSLQYNEHRLNDATDARVFFDIFDAKCDAGTQTDDETDVSTDIVSAVQTSGMWEPLITPTCVTSVLVENHSVASASFCSYAASSEREGCAFEAAPADADPTLADDNLSTKQQEQWTSQQLSDWVRDTLRLANERCAIEIEDQKDKQQCLEARSQVILERWATAKQYFPATLHGELLKMLLDEPRG